MSEVRSAVHIGSNVYKPDESEYDCSNADVLRSCLNEIIQNFDGPEVVVNMEDIAFVDCSALGVLTDSLRFAKQENKQLVLQNPRKSVLKVFQATKTDKLFVFDYAFYDKTHASQN